MGWWGAYEYFSFLCHCHYNYKTVFYRTTSDLKKDEMRIEKLYFLEMSEKTSKKCFKQFKKIF